MGPYATMETCTYDSEMFNRPEHDSYATSCFWMSGASNPTRGPGYYFWWSISLN